jgi:hypothetical protein
MYEFNLTEMLAISTVLIIPIFLFTVLGKSPEQRHKEYQKHKTP